MVNKEKYIIIIIIYTFVWHRIVVASEALVPGSVLVRGRRRKRVSLGEEELWLKYDNVTYCS